MDIKNIFKLIFSLIVCQVAGIIGSVFTSSGLKGWYPTLAKPSFTPVNAIFPLVWTSLFLLMGFSLYFVLKEDYKKPKVKAGISFFSIQILLNITWSFLFFGLRSPFLGFVEIFALWAFIALTIWQFWKIDRKASYLLVPYIAWVTFAIFLNYSIWILNIS